MQSPLQVRVWLLLLCILFPLWIVWFAYWIRCKDKNIAELKKKIKELENEIERLKNPQGLAARILAGKAVIRP